MQNRNAVIDRGQASKSGIVSNRDAWVDRSESLLPKERMVAVKMKNVLKIELDWNLTYCHAICVLFCWTYPKVDHVSPSYCPLHSYPSPSPVKELIFVKLLNTSQNKIRKTCNTCETVPIGLKSTISGSAWSSIERDLVNFFSLPNILFFFFFSVGSTSLCAEPPDKRLKKSQNSV